MDGSSNLSGTAKQNAGKGLFVDWNKLKAEYIAGGTSYRRLAEKYKVSFNTLKTIAIREKWSKLKQQADNEATTKMVDSIAEDMSKNAVKINDVADKLLDKIITLLDEVDGVDSQIIKQLTSSLKDIKDIKGVKSDIDLKEQNARIDKLRKEIETEQTDDRPYGVVLMPPVMPTLVPPSEDDADE